MSTYNNCRNPRQPHLFSTFCTVRRYSDAGQMFALRSDALFLDLSAENIFEQNSAQAKCVPIHCDPLSSPKKTLIISCLYFPRKNEIVESKRNNLCSSFCSDTCRRKLQQLSAVVLCSTEAHNPTLKDGVATVNSFFLPLLLSKLLRNWSRIAHLI